MRLIAVTAHSCTCPQATHTLNKRGKLRGIWGSRAWRVESKAYKARTFPVCSRCFRVGPIVPGHSGEDYAQMETYIQKVREDKVEPLCHQCNRMEAKGKHPCPSCIEKHRDDPDHYIRYINQGQELCWPCEHGIDGIAPKRKHRHFNRHSCDWHGEGQSCTNPLRRDKVCPYSAKTGPEKCDPAFFMARVKAAAVS